MDINGVVFFFHFLFNLSQRFSENLFGWRHVSRDKQVPHLFFSNGVVKVVVVFIGCCLFLFQKIKKDKIHVQYKQNQYLYRQSLTQLRAVISLIDEAMIEEPSDSEFTDPADNDGISTSRLFPQPFHGHSGRNNT